MKKIILHQYNLNQLYMDIINPKTPVYNTLIFYIIIIVTIIIIKPSFLYCEKTQKFRTFGCQEEQTIFPLPVVAIGCGIFLYFIFLLIELFFEW